MDQNCQPPNRPVTNHLWVGPPSDPDPRSELVGIGWCFKNMKRLEVYLHFQTRPEHHRGCGYIMLYNVLYIYIYTSR